MCVHREGLRKEGSLGPTESALAFQGFTFRQRVVRVWKPRPSAWSPHWVAWCKACPKGREHWLLLPGGDRHCPSMAAHSI